jgi:hypothetical protein
VRARRLDPSIKTSVIHTLWMLGDHEAVLASPAGGPIAVVFALVALGREAEGLEFLKENSPKMPAGISRLSRGLRALLEGRHTEAITTIQELASEFRDAEGLYYLARQLAYAGAPQQAVAVLQQSTAAGFFCYPLLASDEWLDSARDLPAFVAVLRRVQEEHELAVAAFAAAGGERILGTD